MFRLQSGTIHPRRRRAHRYRVDLDRAKIASHATAGADPRRTTACTGPTLSTWVAGEDTWEGLGTGAVVTGSARGGEGGFGGAEGGDGSIGTD